MSHVAEALRRARLDGGREVIEVRDHPWAADLQAADTADPTPPASDSAVTQHRAAADPSSAAGVTDLQAGVGVFPGVVPAASRLQRLDARTKQQLTGLIERVFLPVAGDGVRSVGFAAVGPGVASAPIAAALAGELARQTKARVLALDANASDPSLHMQFGIPGISLVPGEHERTAPLAPLAVQVGPNLWVIPGGAAHLRPMLASDPTGVRLARLVGSFDYVVVDLEAAGTPRAVDALVRLVDGVILVIDAEITRRSAGQRAVAALRSWGITIFGAVLTNRRYPVPHAIFQYL